MRGAQTLLSVRPRSGSQLLPNSQLSGKTEVSDWQAVCLPDIKLSYRTTAASPQQAVRGVN